jgi:hypothetical protein
VLLIVFRLTSTTPKLFTEIINPNINNSIIFYPLFRSISLNIKIITTNHPDTDASKKSSSGGGCVYNPNATGRADVGFILLMVLLDHYSF